MNRIEDEMHRRAEQNREKLQWLQDLKSQYQQNLADFRDLMIAHSAPQDHAYQVTIKRRIVDAKTMKKMFRAVLVEEGYEEITCDISNGVSGWVIDYMHDSDTGGKSGRILTADLRVFAWEKYDEKWNVYSRQRVIYPGLKENALQSSEWYFGKDSTAVMALGAEHLDPVHISKDAGAATLAEAARGYLSGLSS